jgi:hypothetical protein
MLNIMREVDLFSQHFEDFLFISFGPNLHTKNFIRVTKNVVGLTCMPTDGLSLAKLWTLTVSLMVGLV